MPQFQKLPVSEHLAQISAKLKRDKRLVLTAEPGAGKSTQVPLHLLKESWLGTQKIIMLEPRRVAARSLAYFLAGQLGEKVGERIGYRVKNDTKVSTRTRLEIVTEGILTNQIQRDPELIDIGLIIFDEFHERNLHSDLGLMLVKEVMGSLRDDLHCLVMSATIDSDSVSNYLEQAPVLHCPGRAFPVVVSYAGSLNSANSFTGKIHNGRNRLSIVQQVYSAVLPFLTDSRHASHDILVFLPGQGEIKRCLSLFEEKLNNIDALNNNIKLFPLYGALPLEQQQQALLPDKDGHQKVIFSTNIAETSLTIEGVSVVIDSGQERQMLFDAKTGMSRLETVSISQASAIQRSGRAGRLGPGQAVRLWSGSQQLSEFQPEEIVTADISQLILNLAEWGQADFTSVDWITAPPKAHYDSCLNTLKQLQLLDQHGKLTQTGLRASHLPLPPRLATILLSVVTPLEASIACDICGLLSEKDLLPRYHTADFSHRLQALWQSSEYKKVINHGALQQVKQTSAKLKNNLAVNLKSRSHFSLADKMDVFPRLLLSGFPDLLAKSRKPGHSTYLLQNGRGAELSEDDPLCKDPWLIVLDINAQAKSGKIWLATSIIQDVAVDLIENKLIETESVFWDEKSGAAKVKSSACYGAIVVKETISTKLTLEQKQQFLLQQIRTKGLSVLNWSKQCDAWLARVSWLSSKADTFPPINTATVLASLEEWLLPYLGKIDNLAGVKKLNMFSLLTSLLDYQQQQLLDKEAPEHFQTPSAKQVLVYYDSQQGPIISVQLQELFGLTESPKLAFGQVPMRFELLSPARRPIQTTSDLAGFWQSSYFDVAKEMRGRYPRHRWPDNPMEEKAGRSIKPRK